MPKAEKTAKSQKNSMSTTPKAEKTAKSQKNVESDPMTYESQLQVDDKAGKTEAKAGEVVSPKSGKLAKTAPIELVPENLYLSFLLTGDQVAAAGTKSIKTPQPAGAKSIKTPQPAGAKSIKTPQPAGAKSIKTPQPAGAKSSKATTAATEVSDQTINAQAAQANPIWTDISISAMAVACAVAFVAVAAVVALLRPRGRRCSSSTSRNEYNRNDIDEGRHYAAAKGRIVQDRQGRSTRVYSR
jgi:hypothetical protein